MGLKQFAQRMAFVMRQGTKVSLPMNVGAKITASGAHMIHPEIAQWLKESCVGEWRFTPNLSVYCADYQFERNSDAVMFKMAWG